MFARGIVIGAAATFAVLSLVPFGGSEGELTRQSLEAIEDRYWKSADLERAEQEGVRAIVDRLRKRHKDRFSHYFDPEQLKQFDDATEGEFSGVGMTVNEVKRGLRVVMTFPGTPAREAGIGKGDLILAVEGKSLAGVPADAAAAEIKGPPGSEVTLTVRFAEKGGRRDVTVERARVRVPAAEGSIRRAKGRRVGYVRYSAFSMGASAELRKHVERLGRRGAEGLLLDLRGNGGGLLDEAVSSASVFIDEGVIVSTEGRTDDREEFEAAGDALEERPMVVLVDRDTASAAEILAAALQDAGLARLVGRKTFGKGTYQQVFELDGGGALDLTVGEFLTGSGRSLAGSGIEPDVRALDDPETRADEAIRRGLAVLGAELDAEG